MEGIVFSGLKLFAALFLVFLNGVYVAAEFAFVKVRQTRVDQMVEEGGASARMVKEAAATIAVRAMTGAAATTVVRVTIAARATTASVAR